MIECVKDLLTPSVFAQSVGAGADVCPVRGSGSGRGDERGRQVRAGASPSSPPGQTTEVRNIMCYMCHHMFAFKRVHFNGLFLFIHTLICIFYLNVKQ